MKGPNIFSYATSELSQDAMIAWLAAWADPGFAKIDYALHSCGINLLEAFYKKKELILPKINSLEVKTQYKKIDVLVIINKSDYIIVEDKTNSKEHGTQLSTYKDEILKLNNVKNIIPIYFKTFEQSCLKEVKNSGYRIFNRGDFLSILQKCKDDGCSNSTLLDYLTHLKSLDDRITAYQKTPITSWKNTGASWQGLFKALQTEMGMGNWGYVPNPSGGFMGFWFSGKDIFLDGSKARSYIQLAEDKLLFKIAVKEKSLQKKLRNAWHKAIISFGNSNGFDEFQKPRFRSGRDMTVADGGEWIICHNDGIVDIPSTVAKLKSIMEFHEILSGQWENC